MSFQVLSSPVEKIDGLAKHAEAAIAVAAQERPNTTSGVIVVNVQTPSARRGADRAHVALHFRRCLRNLAARLGSARSRAL
jgi:hypothetical protein